MSTVTELPEIYAPGRHPKGDVQMLRVQISRDIKNGVKLGDRSVELQVYQGMSDEEQEQIDAHIDLIIASSARWFEYLEAVAKWIESEEPELSETTKAEASKAFRHYKKAEELGLFVGTNDDFQTEVAKNIEVIRKVVELINQPLRLDVADEKHNGKK